MKRRLRVYKKTVSIVNETATGMYENLVGDKKGFLLESYDKNYDRYTFFVKEPEEITLTLEEEIAFIEHQNSSENNLLMIGLLDGEYVGNCSLMGNGAMRYQHRASMGIALYQKYTGLGIGKVMIENLLTIAKEKGLEQIELEVVADNERAIALYKKLGFQIYGTFPDNMKYKDGTYADAYWMMKKL